MPVSYEQVRAFVTVAETGSFSAAARLLKRDRSTLSQVVSNLEMDLGYPLFHRNGRYPELTESGEALYAHAKNLAEYTLAFESISRSIEAQQEAQITVAYSDLLPVNMMTDVMADIREQYKAVNIHWLKLGLEDARDAIDQGKADLAIVLMNSGKSISPKDYIYLMNTVFCAVVSPVMKLASFDSLAVHDLKMYRQLIPEDYFSSHMEQTTLLSSHYQRIASHDLLKALLLAGEGWALLPEYCVADDIEKGTLKRLDVKELNTALRFPFSILSRSEAVTGPVKKALLVSLREQGQLFSAIET